MKRGGKADSEEKHLLKTVWEEKGGSAVQRGTPWQRMAPWEAPGGAGCIGSSVLQVPLMGGH